MVIESICFSYECRAHRGHNLLINAFSRSLPESRISTELMRILQSFANDLSGNLFQWPDVAQFISIDMVSEYARITRCTS